MAAMHFLDQTLKIHFKCPKPRPHTPERENIFLRVVREADVETAVHWNAKEWRAELSISKLLISLSVSQRLSPEWSSARLCRWATVCLRQLSKLLLCFAPKKLKQSLSLPACLSAGSETFSEPLNRRNKPPVLVPALALSFLIITCDFFFFFLSSFPRSSCPHAWSFQSFLRPLSVPSPGSSLPPPLMFWRAKNLRVCLSPVQRHEAPYPLVLYLLSRWKAIHAGRLSP